MKTIDTSRELHTSKIACLDPANERGVLSPCKEFLPGVLVTVCLG